MSKAKTKKNLQEVMTGESTPGMQDLSEVQTTEPMMEGMPQRSLARKWRITIGEQPNPRILYNLVTDEPVTPEEAYAIFLKKTGRSDPVLFTHHCDPLDA